MPMPTQTPGKNPFVLPTPALGAAIAAEWAGADKFSPTKMPLTSLAYTAIDRIAPQQESVVEAVLVYLDTDTLSYRAQTDQEPLFTRQQEQWDPIVTWAARKFGCTWQTVSGIMPADQSPKLHEAVRAYLMTLDAMQLAGLSVLASLYSSLALAIAVVDGHVDAMQAFALSRLEEDTQAERWGKDEEAENRRARIEEETRAVSSFLSALNGALDGAGNRQ